MQSFQTLLRSAWAQTQADAAVLPEDAAEHSAQQASIAFLKALCALALDPDRQQAQTLQAIRALCMEAQLYFREQGL